MFGRRSGPKIACLRRIIGSLASNPIRQTASKAPLVPWRMVLEEATSAPDSILRTQLRRAYGIASIGLESEAAYYDY